MKEYVLSVDYSPITGLRYCNESDFSGEDFYHRKLNAWFADAYQNNEQVKIILDGGEDGYGPSFRDEAFGNLVYDFSLDIVKKILIIESPGEELWKEEIEENTFPDWEKRRTKKETPKQTESHDAWYRLIDNKLERKVWENE